MLEMLDLEQKVGVRDVEEKKRVHKINKPASFSS